MLFAILQKYDFSSKSQPRTGVTYPLSRCLRYCKSTIFQANHNSWGRKVHCQHVVCDTAKVRFFKQITTVGKGGNFDELLFAILQKYDFSSKSQPPLLFKSCSMSCLRYCKSTIFQANHNRVARRALRLPVVCDTAKVRFFKQITTYGNLLAVTLSCLRYCKSTIFQANHNTSQRGYQIYIVVCDTAKVRFFKQITTTRYVHNVCPMLFAILQKYDFSSKSQLRPTPCQHWCRCLRYCKSTIFQANHNCTSLVYLLDAVVCDTAKVRFFKQITTLAQHHSFL